MGTGIPVVIGSQVPWVQVQCGIWHTATYCVPVPWCHGYVTGILPPGEHKFYDFETRFFLFLINFFFIVSHCDTTKYGSASHPYILASYHQAALYSHSYPTTKNQVSCIYIS